MAAILSNTEVEIEQTGVAITVGNDPRAKLMYYLNSVCSVLDLSDEPFVQRLIDYERYYTLSEEEIDKLLILCVLFRPDDLTGKCIFHNEELCGHLNNQFYSIHAANEHLAVTENVIIGGKVRFVKEIMVYRLVWVEKNYFTPMRNYITRLERIANGLPGAEARRAISYSSAPVIVQPSYNNPPRQSAGSVCIEASCKCCCILLILAMIIGIIVGITVAVL